MLLNFDRLVLRHNMTFKGVLHIGGHTGEEHDVYLKYNIPRICYFEPVKANFDRLFNRVRGCKAAEVVCANVALGNVNDWIDINVSSNDGASSSILQPELHLTQYPDIKFSRTERVQICRLDQYSPVDTSLYNFINMDVQGYELEVLKGATQTLGNIDYIMTEVNRDAVYKGCVQIDELDSFLANYGFERFETDWAGGTWGDAFYKKVGVVNGY